MLFWLLYLIFPGGKNAFADDKVISIDVLSLADDVSFGVVLNHPLKHGDQPINHFKFFDVELNQSI